MRKKARTGVPAPTCAHTRWHNGQRTHTLAWPGKVAHGHALKGQAAHPPTRPCPPTSGSTTRLTQRKQMRAHVHACLHACVRACVCACVLACAESVHPDCKASRVPPLRPLVCKHVVQCCMREEDPLGPHATHQQLLLPGVCSPTRHWDVRHLCCHAQPCKPPVAARRMPALALAGRQ